MAGMNEEEDYLHQLLENAMKQDAGLEEDDIVSDSQDKTVSDDDDEIFDIFSGGEPQEEITDFLAPDENTDDDLVLEDDFADIAGIGIPEEDDEPFTDIVLDESQDAVGVSDETSAETEKSFDDNDIFSIDDLISNVEEESIVTDEEPDVNDIEDAVEPVVPDGDINLEEESAVPDELNLDDLQGLYDEQEQDTSDDILVLDEGTALPEAPKEDAGGIPAEDEASPAALLDDDIEAVNTDGADVTADTEDSEKEVKKSKASKKKSKEKKEKPPKKKGEKKFSLKNFFMDEDEDSGDKTTDENQQLINELYENKSSLDDADPNDIDASVKKKKEKKVKEKKEKPKKEPKPKKVKEPKDKTQNGGFNAGLLFKALLIAAVLVAAVIFGSRFLVYHNTVKDAREYFESGNYPAAYKSLSGIDVREKDSDLYMKVRTVMIVYNGLESYENYIALGDVPHALDALIMSVGRKNRNEELAIRYEVTNEVNVVYNRLISMLDKYGISEAQALDYFTMRDYKEYFAILESIGGQGRDSDN